MASRSQRWKAHPAAIALPLLLAASVLALTLAYVSQYAFGLMPCELCLYQRYPYWVAILFALTGTLAPKPEAKRFWLLLTSLALLIGAAIALYHTGVEQKWWQGPVDCSQIESFDSLDSMRAALKSATVVRCDEPAWQWGPLTMASGNVFYSTLLALFGMLSLRKKDPLRENSATR